MIANGMNKYSCVQMIKYIAHSNTISFVAFLGVWELNISLKTMVKGVISAHRVARWNCGELPANIIVLQFLIIFIVIR